jgi:ribonuclease D
VVTTLSAEHTMPAENLISPDAIRRLSWEPPDPAGTADIAAALAGSGARPWQAELVAPRVAAAWRDLPDDPSPQDPPKPENHVKPGNSPKPGNPSRLV